MPRDPLGRSLGFMGRLRHPLRMQADSRALARQQRSLPSNPGAGIKGVAIAPLCRLQFEEAVVWTLLDDLSDAGELLIAIASTMRQEIGVGNSFAQTVGVKACIPAKVGHGLIADVALAPNEIAGQRWREEENAQGAAG